MFFQSDFEFSKKQYDFCKTIYLQTWALRSAFSLEPKVSETQECIGLTWLYIMVIYCCNFQIFVKCIGLLVVLKHHPQVCVCHQNCCSDLPCRRGQNFKTGPKCSLRRILREGSGWDCLQFPFRLPTCSKQWTNSISDLYYMGRTNPLVATLQLAMAICKFTISMHKKITQYHSISKKIWSALKKRARMNRVQHNPVTCLYSTVRWHGPQATFSASEKTRMALMRPAAIAPDTGLSNACRSLLSCPSSSTIMACPIRGPEALSKGPAGGMTHPQFVFTWSIICWLHP